MYLTTQYANISTKLYAGLISNEWKWTAIKAEAHQFATQEEAAAIWRSHFPKDDFEVSDD